MGAAVVASLEEASCNTVIFWQQSSHSQGTICKEGAAGQQQGRSPILPRPTEVA